ncbi:MAG: hypothetical protein RIS36_725 [Pseudomonadota bacterium]|jgi:hypothetical protein
MSVGIRDRYTLGRLPIANIQPPASTLLCELPAHCSVPLTSRHQHRSRMRVIAPLAKPLRTQASAPVSHVVGKRSIRTTHALGRTLSR